MVNGQRDLLAQEVRMLRIAIDQAGLRAPTLTDKEKDKQ